MLRRLVLALPVCLALASVGVAGIATNRYTITTEEKGHAGAYLAVRKGRLVLGRSTFGVVSDNQDAADRWYIAGSKIKSSVGGGYLAYDPTGKSNGVFLSPEPGEGTDWSFGFAAGRQREGERGVVRALSGPLKGWYLDAAEGGKGGLVLSKDPSRKLEAERVWEHK